MQQLVCIARALVRDPRVLILDEPTSVLTEGETQKLMDVLRELKEQGIACIYISHKLDEVFAISDRMVILRDGTYISEYRKEDGYAFPGACQKPGQGTFAAHPAHAVLYRRRKSHPAAAFYPVGQRPEIFACRGQAGTAAAKPLSGRQASAALRACGGFRLFSIPYGSSSLV